MIGKELGQYQIEALVGAGGMGEVYRARDTRLGRTVAVKILPETFAKDPERVARFEREAKLLASLNHANIAVLYGREEFNGTHFLAMELVEGETLAERIGRGRMPVEEALRIAHQIAEAFEAAHEKGVIHRDLKPANVKITPEGKVKVLDFGLAKALEAAPAQIASNSPTLLSAMATNAGMVLGTAGYMSPEQARGHAADQRSDIFSFGCVLFEMLTGRQTFPGETVADVIGSVMAREPDWQAIPADLNPEIEGLLRRCLAKNRKERWHAIADVRVELETIMADPYGAKLLKSRSPERPPLWKRVLPIVITALIVAAGTNVFDRIQRPVSTPGVTRFSLAVPADQRFTNLTRRVIAMSPDGANVVYIANNEIYLRSMSDMQARSIHGTGEGTSLGTPFFSPDSQWIGFFTSGATEGSLKKIAVTGGSAVTICNIPQNPSGASWSADGQIFIGQARNGILRVNAGGGKPETVVTLQPGETAYGPELLPGGEFLLFTLANAEGLDRWDNAKIVVQSLKSGERTVLVEGGADAWYVPTGHLVYGHGSTMLAVPFDVRRIRLTGSPAPIVEGVMRSAANQSGVVQFSFSNNGSLVFLPGNASDTGPERYIALVDRSGNQRQLLNLPSGRYNHPRISPDGKQLALAVEDPTGQNIWIHDLAGSVSARRLTFGGTDNNRPTWTPDGQRIVFTSNRDNDRNSLYWQTADGKNPAESLVRAEPGKTLQPESWSRDQSKMTFSVEPGGGRSTIWMFSRGDSPRQLIEIPMRSVTNSSISPDGHWLAYWANESGRADIYVQPIPLTGSKYQISYTGGTHYPLWSPDGKQLFYVVDQPGGTGQIMAVDIQTQPNFVIGKTTPLPIRGIVFNGPRGYDITPDGKFFVVMFPRPQGKPGEPTSAQINVVLNWFSELQQRVPAK